MATMLVKSQAQKAWRTSVIIQTAPYSEQRLVLPKHSSIFSLLHVFPKESPAVGKTAQNRLLVLFIRGANGINFLPYLNIK